MPVNTHKLAQDIDNFPERSGKRDRSLAIGTGALLVCRPYIVTEISVCVCAKERYRDSTNMKAIHIRSLLLE